ncbi:MAG: acyl-CoA dehydrogenase family protein [Roseovarius sp.]|nr:acyl-CoA dehydrogenase family protein [Roseovarius sp.]
MLKKHFGGSSGVGNAPNLPARKELKTHSVENQPQARGGWDMWASDPAFQHYSAAAGADRDLLAEYGNMLGSEDMRISGRLANECRPELQLFDAGGRRLDQVNFHPAYHDLMRAGIGAGYSGIAWEGVRGGHATHAGMVYLTSQIEPGVCCPMTMTYAAVPALGADKSIHSEWAPALISREYDIRQIPVAKKKGATFGMAMTEKQGGSDVRANTTIALADGCGYRLRGHKWFCSAPMSDGFLTLAQAKGGLTCFLVPRWLPNERNSIEIQRLKNKLGNRSNASAEIEFSDAYAIRLGEEGNGVREILEMVHYTRFDTALAPAGLMRAALDHAGHWVSNRLAFNEKLSDRPLMRQVLADIVLDWEGTLALCMHVAGYFDRNGADERSYARLSVALAKFMGNKLCPNVVYEAMECLGGMGYVEDTPLPLLYREAPLNSIWEGSGNVICLDILRTLRRAPASAEILACELDKAIGHYTFYDEALSGHRKRFPSFPKESEARWFAENLALLLTASVLIRTAPSAIAESYLKTRLGDGRGRAYGSVGSFDIAAALSRIGIS